MSPGKNKEQNVSASYVLFLIKKSNGIYLWSSQLQIKIEPVSPRPKFYANAGWSQLGSVRVLGKEAKVALHFLLLGKLSVLELYRYEIK